MAQKDNILEELNSLNSSLVKDNKNPYQVHDGYFDGLAEQVLRRIRAMEIADPAGELTALSPFLASLPKTNPYVVPARYFEELDPSFVTIDDEKEITLSP